jgi:hypothetical protein
MRDRNPERSKLGDVFDRTFRRLHDVPETVQTKATTVRAVDPVLEIASTFIVQTVPHKDLGDHIFIEYIGTDGSMRATTGIRSWTNPCCSPKSFGLGTKTNHAGWSRGGCGKMAKGPPALS